MGWTCRERPAVRPAKTVVTIGILILLTIFITAQTVFLSCVYMFIGHNIVTSFTGTEDPPLNIIQFGVRLEIAAEGGLVIGLFSGILSSVILGFLLFLDGFRCPEAAGRVHKKLQFLNSQDKKARMIYLSMEILSASAAGPIGYLILSPDMGSDRIGLNLWQVWVVVLLGKLVTVLLGRLWGLVRRRSEPTRSPLLGRWTVDAIPTTISR